MSVRKDYFLETLVPYSVTFKKDVLLQADETFELEGYSRTSLVSVFQFALQKAEAENLNIEVIHHPLDNNMQGIYFPTLRKLIWSNDFLNPYQSSLLSLYAEKEIVDLNSSLSHAQTIFKNAHHIHDQKEKIYIQKMDFEFLDILTDAVIQRLLRREKHRNFQAGKPTNQFFGAPLANGNINYISSLTSTVSKRYLIKGRPGSGKSTFLKKIASALLEHGFDVELYHCSMDANSLDMIIARELDVALFDCTPPHEQNPIPNKDEIIDLFKECLPQTIDIEYKAQLEKLDHEYKNLIIEGKKALQDVLNKENKLYMQLKVPAEKELDLLRAEIASFLF